MKTLGRVLSLLSGLGALLISARTPTRAGRISWLYFTLKLLATALAPLLALFGLIGAVLGALSKDQLSIFGGLIGAGVSGRQIVEAVEARPALERSFGPHIETRFSEARRERMLPRRWAPLLTPSPASVRKRDFVVGHNLDSGRPVRADAWEPAVGTPRSGVAILYLHGSGYHYLDKDKGTAPLFRHLNAQGHVVIDLAYTLRPHSRWRGMLYDVKQAIAWLKDSADVYRIDPERIVLMGASAGAQLALLAAYSANDPRYQYQLKGDTSVRAVAAYYPPTDLTLFDLSAMERVPDEVLQRPLTWLEITLQKQRFLPPEGRLLPVEYWLPEFIGGMYEECPDEYHEASPVKQVRAGLPPTLLIHGTHDALVPVEHSRLLHHRLLQAGVKAALVEIPGAEHAFDLILPATSPVAQAAVYEVDRFLGIVT